MRRHAEMNASLLECTQGAIATPRGVRFIKQEKMWTGCLVPVMGMEKEGVRLLAGLTLEGRGGWKSEFP